MAISYTALLLFGLIAVASIAEVQAKSDPSSVGMPSGQCTPKRCRKAAKRSYVGFFKMFNKKQAGYMSTEEVDTVSECCNLCRKMPGCVYWQLTSTDLVDQSGKCHLMDSEGTPQLAQATVKATRIGGKCNAEVKDDPHFVGARGTRFDFNGAPDTAFALVSDKDLEINMMLRGYYDNRTAGATVVEGGKAVRTWIKEVGVVWAAEGAEHKLHMVARDGTQQERGNGYLASATVDGFAVPALREGETFSAAGGLELTFVGVEQQNQFDVDRYTLTVAGLLDLDLQMRVARREMQAEDDAEAHFNLGLNKIQATRAVHGVLGQTYRKDHEQRAFDYQEVVAALGVAVQADGASGAGFLDGAPADYIVSGVLATDSHFNSYEGVPTTLEEDDEDNQVQATA
eukprot:jgi/Mesen1/9894/ME000070S09177